jgi:hypothetical protein
MGVLFPGCVAGRYFALLSRVGIGAACNWTLMKKVKKRASVKKIYFFMELAPIVHVN